MADLTIRAATAEDVPTLINLINAAYEVESGDSGIAFKRTERIVRDEEVSAPVAEGRVRVCMANDGSVLGTIIFKLEGAHSIGFGPFAVAPAAQRKGVGKALLGAVEAEGRARGCRWVQLEIVNHRSDLVDYYRSLNFVPVAEAPFVDVERLTRPCNFIVFRKRLHPAPATPAAAQSLEHVIDVIAADPALQLRLARPEDIDVVVPIINAAYVLEEGCEGVAFKQAGAVRLRTPTEAEGWIADGKMIVAEQIAPGSDGASEARSLLGCIVFSVSHRDDGSIESLYFGPLAVKGDQQGKGVGGLLMAAIEAYARANDAAVRLQVVSCRSDNMAMYLRRGYKEVGTAPWVPGLEHMLTRPVHFVLMRKEFAYGAAPAPSATAASE
jgi:GNAT superfamily N-acetyltransferase